MVDQVEVQVLKITPNTNKEKIKRRQKSKIISNITKLLSRKSLGGDGMHQENPATILLTGKQLNSDLFIHPPANGKFTTELQLNKVLGNDIKLVLVKVYGTKLQILLGKKDPVKYEGKNNGQDKGKFSKVGKNVIKKLGLARKNSENKNEKECIQMFKEEDLTVYGHICLPDYVSSETLQFSVDCFGDLHIKANIKGAIGI